MIKVFLMNTPVVYKGEERISFAYKKEEGLFYYLCVEQTITRNQAAGIFWADCNDQTARKNLRNALYHLRRLLGDDIFKATGNRIVELNMERVWVDVRELDESNIRENYRGDFLEYFYIKDCMEFEEWTEKERYRLKKLYVSACKACVQEMIRKQDLHGVQEQYEFLLDNSVYDEKLYRGIMEMEMRAGQYNEAIQTYHKLEEVLQKELDSAPEKETEELYVRIQDIREQVRRGLERKKADYFYGRTDELYRLKRELRCFLRTSSREEDAHSILILGEAGVGKSCLLKEFEQYVSPQHAILLHYDCVQSGEGMYFRPWYEICMQIQEKGLETDFEAGYLDQFLKLSGNRNDEFFSAQMGLFIENTFRKVVEKYHRRIVLIFDDLQWMDVSSQHLLAYLVYHMGSKNLLLAGACRSDCCEKTKDLIIPLEKYGLLIKMELSRFNLEESREIIVHLMPELEKNQALVEKIYRITEGNGLFLTETIKLLQNGSVDETMEMHNFSPGMVNIIQSRLLSLDENDRRILEALSIQTEFMTLEDVKATVRMAELEIADSLDHLLKARFIYERDTEFGTGYSFVHRLIQDYIYGTLTRARKETSHRLLAEYLEGELQKNPRVDRYPYLVYHFGQCGQIYKMYQYKLEYFISFYTIYHEVYPDRNEYVEGSAFWQQQMTNAEALNQVAEEIRTLCAGRHDPKMQELRMKTEYLIGRYSIAFCDYEKGLRSVSLSLEIATQLQSGEYIYKCNLLKIFYGIQVLDLPLMEQCLKEIEKDSKESLLNRGTFMRLKGLYLLRSGRYGEAQVALGEAIRDFEMLGSGKNTGNMALAACYNYLGESWMKLEDSSQAKLCFTKAIMLAEEGRLTNGSGIFYTNMADLLYREKQYEESEKYCRLALHTFLQTGALWGRERLEVCLARLDMDQGKWTEAGKHLEYAKGAAEKIGNPDSLRLVEQMRQKAEKIRLVMENREQKMRK